MSCMPTTQGSVLVSPTADRDRMRRALRRALVAAIGVLIALVVVDQLVWLTFRRDAIAARVYAEVPPPEPVSPFAREPVPLPPVRVALGGLSRDEALARLRAAIGGKPGIIVLRDPEDGREWPYALADLGLLEWAPRAADAALAVGRGSALAVGRGSALVGWLARQRALLAGHRVVVPPSFDAQAARRALEALAPEVDVAPQAAAVTLDEGEASAVEPRLGHQLDIEGTLAALAAVADLPASQVALAISPTAPAVFDTRNVAAALEAIRSGPLTMVDRLGQPYAVDADTVARWLTLADVPNADGVPVPSIVVDREAIRAWLTTLVPLVAREPTEGRFRWVDGLIESIAAPQDGYALDVEASIDRVVDAAYAVPHLGELFVHAEPPRAARQAAEALLDVAPVASASTSLAGSPGGRMLAIELAVSRLDGSVVPPGAVLSLRDPLGAVAPEAGYDAAWLLGPRDWLSQLATTAFRAALKAGLPIAERHAPAWRSGWYEPPVGVDADVDAIGAPFAGAAPRDLRIANDTDGWLLFEVEVDPAGPRLTWTVWTVEEPRAVRLEGPSVAAVEGVAEAVRLAEPALPVGATVQVGWAREGAEARFGRTTVVGTEVRQDAFESRYAPAPDVFVDGSGPR